MKYSKARKDLRWKGKKAPKYKGKDIKIDIDTPANDRSYRRTLREGKNPFYNPVRYGVAKNLKHAKEGAKSAGKTVKKKAKKNYSYAKQGAKTAIKSIKDMF
jgi:hypothetical protein